MGHIKAIPVGIIDNGGFQYFFEADWPDNPPYSLFIDAFKRVGATKTAELMAEAVSLFPFPNPELDFQMRNNFMDSLPRDSAGNSSLNTKSHQVWNLSDENFTPLANYIRVNFSFFPNAKQIEET